MKSITFRVGEELIERARIIAQARGTTLNDAFRNWLLEYSVPVRGVSDVESLLKRLAHIKAGRRFTREEMNER